ncbi:MAG: hypothetical protein HZB68_00770 [Candidatus Aenigmarchaeota archaeon]|nr:hypothetical protein [Candidatus Aenigmarchaeota archaeon]
MASTQDSEQGYNWLFTIAVLVVLIFIVILILGETKTDIGLLHFGVNQGIKNATELLSTTT